MFVKIKVLQDIIIFLLVSCSADKFSLSTRTTTFEFVTWPFINGSGNDFDIIRLNSPTKAPVRLSSIEDLLESDLSSYMPPGFEDLIANISNSFQRHVVAIQLRFCPNTRLCTLQELTSLFPSETDLYAELYCGSCNCDFPSCLRDRDCCPDILEAEYFDTERYTVSHDGRLPKDTDGSKKMKGVTSEPAVTRECMSLGLNPYSGAPSIYIVAACPSSVDYASKCTQEYAGNTDKLVDVAPCYDKKTFETFRNRFCAYCNGVSDDDIVFLDPALKCGSNPHFDEMSSIQNLVDYVLMKDNCDIEFDLGKNYSVFKYCSRAVDKCNTTGLWRNYSLDVDLACNAYTSNIHYQEAVYRNIFCVLCNRLDTDDLTWSNYNSYHDKSSLFSFTGLLKIETLDKKADIDEKCHYKEIYDSLKVK